MTEVSFHEELLQQLLADAEKGRNDATFVVSCSDGKMNLHRIIASKSSSFLEKFDDASAIDCETFSHCRRYMYLGSCSISNENVAAILAAADFLLMEKLRDECFRYLEIYLDHTNYETVIEIADQYDNPQLRAHALRFRDAGAAKIQLVRTRLSLSTEMQVCDKEIEHSSGKKRKIVEDIDKLEEQWNELLQKDIDDATSHCKASSPGEHDSSFEHAREIGAVARLVVDCSHEYYVGFSTYEPAGDENKRRTSSKGDDEEDCRPPPPTKEQYEKLGILYTYAYLDDALEACKPGDRLYVAGKHDFMTWTSRSTLEILALPGHRAIFQLSRCDQYTFWRVAGGSLRISGVKFQYKPSASAPSGESGRPLLEFCSPEGELLIHNCVFDLGANPTKALHSRVSGILLEQGKLARVEHSNFIGGGGSAIAIVNDPYHYVARIEAISNVFTCTGQHSFAAQRMATSSESMQGSLKETVPGPGAIEMWRLNRRCYFSRATQQREIYRETSVILSGNSFSHNMRAPLAYRSLSGAKEVRRNIYSPAHPKPRPTIKLYTDLSEIDDVTNGFDISIDANRVLENGLEFTTGNQNWLEAVLDEPPTKKRRLSNDNVSPDGDGSRMATFPNGDSLLAVAQVVEEGDGFPPGFEETLPCPWWKFRSLFNV